MPFSAPSSDTTLKMLIGGAGLLILALFGVIGTMIDKRFDALDQRVTRNEMIGQINSDKLAERGPRVTQFDNLMVEHQTHARDISHIKYQLETIKERLKALEDLRRPKELR